MGSHQELLKKEGKYYSLWQGQRFQEIASGSEMK